ncbi:MAG: M12 family metallo-peptidase [Flavobacterium sp.]
MKNNLLLIMMLCVSGLFAQNKVGQKVQELQNLKAEFKPFSVLSPTQNAIDNTVSKVVDGATMATINIQQINDIVSNQYETIELHIPYQNNDIAVLLYKVNPFAEGFHVDTNKKKYNAYQKGVYYRGIIKGQLQTVSSFNFFNGEFNGIISSSELGNVVVGKLDKVNNRTDYIVYSDAKMKVLNDFDCHVKDDLTETPKNGNANRNVASARCVGLYFEIDNDLFLANNSDITTTTNWMTSVFNNVQTLYNNDGISVNLKSIFIWEDGDPYEGVGTTSAAYLNAFSQTTPVFDGDLGQLLGIDEGGLGGVAVAINGLCSSSNYSYADVNYSFSTVPTYSWTIQVITHEYGHLLGSRHTHACVWNGNNTSIDGCGTQAGYSEGSCALGPIPSAAEKGTIMSYCHLIQGIGISFNNGFGPQPTTAILNAVNGGTCLSPDCAGSCPNTVSNINASNITPTSAQISWDELGSATSWEVAVTPFASTNIVWTTVTTNSYLAEGLTANAYYKVRVRPLCAGIEPATREKIFISAAANFCSNTPFTDSGGATGQYTNMENWTRTMTPNNPGLKLRITFSSFNLETDYDYLYIYNGPADFYVDLTNGGLTGTSNPGTFNSTAPDGSLTVKFVSDQGVVANGWNATISCTGTLGIEDAGFLDYSYYPNPTNGNVTIKSKDIISEVTVYNVQGQLLSRQNANASTANVDISQFANGTYFFKLKINDSEANFKILKM